MLLDIIVKTEGVFDIISAMCLMRIINFHSLSFFRLSIFNDYKVNKVNTYQKFNRLFGYYLFMNGILKFQSNDVLIITYASQSYFIFNEILNCTSNENGIIVSLYYMTMAINIFLNYI
jgi:hypothetical protein